MEKKSKAQGVAGRLIPVPREISAGCGLAWCAPLEERENLREKLVYFGINYQEIHEVLV